MKNSKIKNYLGRNFKKKRGNDKLSEKVRSQLMSKVLSKNTKFELKFISDLESFTERKFVTHVKKIRGKPDIVFMKERTCVFLDSDFWHGWQYPRWKHLLKNDFWRTKIENNRKRDRKNTKYLRNNGWKVLRIWEHSIKGDSTSTLNLLIQLLSKYAHPQIIN